MHQQPALLKRGLFAGERYPVAERLARRGLYLPSGLGSSASDFRRVAKAVRGALERA
jgi:perosamine synthetase